MPKVLVDLDRAVYRPSFVVAVVIAVAVVGGFKPASTCHSERSEESHTRSSNPSSDGCVRPTNRSLNTPRRNPRQHLSFRAERGISHSVVKPPIIRCRNSDSSLSPALSLPKRSIWQVAGPVREPPLQAPAPNLGSIPRPARRAPKCLLPAPRPLSEAR